MTKADVSLSYYAGSVARPKLPDYAMKYAHILTLERSNGILTARLHSNGGVMGPSGWFNAWNQAWLDIGNDPENEIIIITATGERWIEYPVPPENSDGNSVGVAAAARSGQPDLASAAAYGVYRDCLKNIENVIFALNVPTIGVIQAPAFVHYEAALFCDLTLCADDAVFRDPHADFGLPPGDGLGLAFQHFLNPKQQAYYLYTSDMMDAETALRLGLVNEILPKDELLDRALEIANRILRTPKLGRFMTKQIVRRSAQLRYVQDAAFHMAHEMVGILGNSADGSAHTHEKVRASVDSFEAEVHRRDGK